MKSLGCFLFLLLFLNSPSVNAQNSLTKEQEEFVEITKTILLDREVNKFLEDNGLFCMTEGKTIYLLNKYTPFYVVPEVGNPLQNYRETYKKKTQLSICDEGVIFFVMPEKFIKVKNYNIIDNTATITFEFIEDKDQNIFEIQKYNLKKETHWSLLKAND